MNHQGDGYTWTATEMRVQNHEVTKEFSISDHFLYLQYLNSKSYLKKIYVEAGVKLGLFMGRDNTY